MSHFFREAATPLLYQPPEVLVGFCLQGIPNLNETTLGVPDTEKINPSQKHLVFRSRKPWRNSPLFLLWGAGVSDSYSEKKNNLLYLFGNFGGSSLHVDHVVSLLPSALMYD